MEATNKEQSGGCCKGTPVCPVPAGETKEQREARLFNDLKEGLVSGFSSNELMTLTGLKSTALKLRLTKLYRINGVKGRKELINMLISAAKPAATDVPLVG